ncbi:hypothetical protein I3760_11G087100 [Carya illinoinensis]|nr:hypothetical protein I3760_11G087100 [Carya illinoinensis]
MQTLLLCKASVWLALDKERKQLSVETTADQDPLVTKGSALIPLIGIDVWAHACYLQGIWTFWFEVYAVLRDGEEVHIKWFIRFKYHAIIPKGCVWPGGAL